jgi:hypothetical protein
MEESPPAKRGGQRTDGDGGMIVRLSDGVNAFSGG